MPQPWRILICLVILVSVYHVECRFFRISGSRGRISSGKWRKMPKIQPYQIPAFNKAKSSKPLGSSILKPKTAAKLGAAGAAGALVPMGLGLYAAHKLRKPFKMHDRDSSEEMYDDDYYNQRRGQYYPNRVRQVEYVSTSEVTLTNQGTEPSDSERNATSQPEVVPSEFAMLKQTDPESISEERGTIRNLINFGKDKSQYKDLYFVALVVGASLLAISTVIGTGYCFYKFQQYNKAASDVDYPAYGVVGPQVKDSSMSPDGDRKLAQSAQMYHYHHQKQQMIASEKVAASRHTSASDVDSDEENEEGDYTVYECPGLAATGEMEVKNPLFQDDLTPIASPMIASKEEKSGEKEKEKKK